MAHDEPPHLDLHYLPSSLWIFNMIYLSLTFFESLQTKILSPAFLVVKVFTIFRFDALHDHFCNPIFTISPKTHYCYYYYFLIYVLWQFPEYFIYIELIIKHTLATNKLHRKKTTKKKNLTWYTERVSNPKGRESYW